MKKNIVFIIDVNVNSNTHSLYQYSVDSWKQWCAKHDIEMFILSECLVDYSKMGIFWQRYYLFDILDANEIEYDQVLMLDACTIPHPDCPNVFELSEHKLVGVHNDSSYNQILCSLENYAEFVFDGFHSKFWNYINCGFIIVNTSHKQFFKTIIDFYWQHADVLKQIESAYNDTDQTPFNILVERNEIDLKILPYEYNMIDLARKEILTDDLMFTHIGWIYQFNFIPSNNNDNNIAALYWAKKTYEALYGK